MSNTSTSAIEAVCAVGHQLAEATALSPHETPRQDVFVGRQPIYTEQLEVFAYEVLFSRGEKLDTSVNARMRLESTDARGMLAI